MPRALRLLLGKRDGAAALGSRGRGGGAELRGPSAVAVRDFSGPPPTARHDPARQQHREHSGRVGGVALALAYCGGPSGIPVATAVMTVLVLMLCEILPKAAAASPPRGLLAGGAAPLILHQLLRPVHRLFDRVIDPVVRRDRGQRGYRFRGVFGRGAAARAAPREGAEAGSPLAIIGATAGAAEMHVEEIMVPRTEIVAFPVTTSPPRCSRGCSRSATRGFRSTRTRSTTSSASST